MNGITYNAGVGNVCIYVLNDQVILVEHIRNGF